MFCFFWCQVSSPLWLKLVFSRVGLEPSPTLPLSLWAVLSCWSRWDNEAIQPSGIITFPPSEVSSRSCSQRRNWDGNRTTGMENGWLVSLAESLTLCNEPNKGVVSSQAVIRGLSAAEVILNSFYDWCCSFSIENNWQKRDRTDGSVAELVCSECLHLLHSTMVTHSFNSLLDASLISEGLTPLKPRWNLQRCHPGPRGVAALCSPATAAGRRWGSKQFGVIASFTGNKMEPVHVSSVLADYTVLNTTTIQHTW